MVINLKTFKTILWVIVTLLIVLSFPIQVYTGSPYPSIIPYGLILFIFSLTFIIYRKSGLPRYIFLPKNFVGLVVRLYMFMVITHTLLLVLLGLISLYECVSSFVIYLLPVLFYCYFRKLASEIEVRSVMVTMAIASIVVGLYFAYDSYVKLALREVSDYAVKAFEYSTIRAGNQNSGEMNEARIAIGYRSFGLLETHSVSGIWVIIGALSSLSLIKREKKFIRLIIVFIFGLMLLLGLNFTSIIAYFFIIFLFEFGGLSILRFRFSINLIVNILVCVLLLFILSILPGLILGDVMAEFIYNNILGQKELALGGLDNQNISMISITLKNLQGYFLYISNTPHTLFIGDGFSSFGMKKGGDVGFIETFTKLGLPFFLTIFYGLVRLMSKAIKKIKIINASDNVKFKDKALILQFAVSFTLMIFISELHYSIWASKSVLPFLFFTISLYDRYGCSRFNHDM